MYRWKGEGTVMRMQNLLVNSLSLSLAVTSSFSLATAYRFNTIHCRIKGVTSLASACKTCATPRRRGRRPVHLHNGGRVLGCVY